MPKTHILLVDDEKAITDYLAPILERAGYRVTVVRDGVSALEWVRKNQAELVVLDVILPGMDGREVCRQMRAAGNWTPVIMLTQISSLADKIFSLEEGADDYLCKPFDPQELIARVRAVLRRRQSFPTGKPLQVSKKIQVGAFTLDRRTRRVELGGRCIDLTPKGYALLEYLALHPDQVFTREQLMDEVWGWAQAVATRAVDMRVAELRRALGDDPDQPIVIDTVIGVGYRLLAPVEVLE